VINVSRAVAAVAVVGATALMWSDGAVGVWKSIVDFALRSNEAVTSTVMGARQWGDADLHVAVWGAVAVCVLLAMPSPRARWQALVCLLAWSWFVELAQPWFTEIRSRQFVDALGNTVGIIGAYAVMSVVTRVRRARGEAGTFFAGSERAEGVDARER
jgi:hypothetical protein